MAPASWGPGDEDTEFELDNERVDAQDAEGRVPTTRDHLPYLSDCPYSDTDSDSDISMDHWSYPGDIDQRPEYEDGLMDYYEEDELVRTAEMRQETDDFVRDMALLREREAAEWPEVMPRQYDESVQVAHRRQLILTIVRGFLRA